MTLFKYKAVRANGETFSGQLEAADRFALYKEVRKEGGTVLSVDTGGTRKAIFSMERVNIFLGRVKMAEKIMFLRNLGAMIKAGLPLARGLSVMERQTKNPKLKKILEEIESGIRQGGTLHDGFAKFPHVFSKLVVSMIKAGEESGSLGDSLAVITQQMERSYHLSKKIHGALIYPAIVVCAMVAVGVLMLIFIVPTLTATFNDLGVELPTSTRIVIGASDFLSNNTVLALGLLLAVVAAFIFAGRTKRGKRILDWLFLRLPIVGGLVRETNAARTARTLSSLLSSGVPVINSLSITEEVLQNSYFKEVIREAQEKIQKGEQIAVTFEKYPKLYPVLIAEMMAVGEETGKLSEILLDVAVFYEEEVERKTKDMSTIIEPFLMVIIGVVVGFFAVSMISPIYSISA